MNAVLKALLAALQLATNWLPPAFRPVAQLIAGILGTMNLPEGDPKTEKAAEIISGLVMDLDAALQIEDIEAQTAARLTLENRAHRALVELVGGGGA